MKQLAGLTNFRCTKFPGSRVILYRIKVTNNFRVGTIGICDKGGFCFKKKEEWKAIPPILDSKLSDSIAI